MKHLFRYVMVAAVAIAATLGVLFGLGYIPAQSVTAAAAPQTTLPALSNIDYDPTRGPVPVGKTMFTFDDCQFDTGVMKQTILAAEQQDIGMTLAMTGACVQYYRYAQDDPELRDIVQFARDHGQYVISHSNTHPHMIATNGQPAMEPHNVRAELVIDGLVSNYYRPPFGEVDATIESVTKSLNMRIWTWGDNLDTNDWKGKTLPQVVDYVKAQASADGGTFLLHQSKTAFTPEGLSQLKSAVESKGGSVCRAYPDGPSPAVLPDQLPC